MKSTKPKYHQKPLPPVIDWVPKSTVCTVSCMAARLRGPDWCEWDHPGVCIFCDTVASTGVQQRVCECTWAQVFARCVYDPLRSSAWLIFHVTFSTASRRKSQRAECEPPGEWRWGVGGFEQADKILSKTFLYLELNMERDSERWKNSGGSS